MLMAFILASKLEALTIQLTALYDFTSLISRPIFLVLIICVLSLFVYGVSKRNTLEYA